MVRCRCRAGGVCPDRGACRLLWRPHDSDRLTRPGTGNATRHRTEREERNGHVQFDRAHLDRAQYVVGSANPPPCGGGGAGSGYAPGCSRGCGALRVGAVLATDEFPATAAGYRDLLKRARKWGTVRRAGVEGTGSYGASLSRYLLAQGIDVFDVNRMDRADRRWRGKSDPLDAQNAARAVLSGRASARAKTGDGPVQIARMYKLTKVSAVKARTQAINQLKAVLVTADPDLREELARLGNAELYVPVRSSPV
ncbi:IS110 family transposase [Streptomyces noursei]|uniref:IS110 family transposase n=1 Tax=Streptomyces noursei TaxID=1971 RepID=UPI001E4248E9|nr:IS110 family transposase [Streptomyces noursei]MCZ1014164.1 transposase [Streptomyces noursei]